MIDDAEDTMPNSPPLRTCSNCGIEYPAKLIHPFVQYLRGKVTEQHLCGICALIITNEATGIYRTEFGGAEAEQLRQAALAYRKSKGL